MKRLLCFIMSICFLVLSVETHAQLDVGKTVKEKVEKRAKKGVDKTIEKGLDEVEEAAKDAVSNDPEGKEPAEKSQTSKDIKADDPKARESSETTSSPLKAWSKYDFVPGDKIIFEDNLMGEQNGEFPSKWDLLSGNAENAMLGSESVISFVKSGTEIAPLMKKPNYLPEVFTIEFDVYFYHKYNEAYTLALKKANTISIRPNSVSMGSFTGRPEVVSKKPGWHHIALSFNKRALKVYFNQDRVLNIPNVKEKPAEFSISALSHGVKAGDPALIRNIRVAEGGVRLYDQFLTDGKIVTRGILFESGKATLKPESMGVIKEIVQIMRDHADIRFTIEGHTDSDGDDAFNQRLSEQRAGAVKDEFTKLGIHESRLQTKGWGESKPVDNNSTPEGKANNRRVEFVKI